MCSPDHEKPLIWSEKVTGLVSCDKLDDGPRQQTLEFKKKTYNQVPHTVPYLVSLIYLMIKMKEMVAFNHIVFDFGGYMDLFWGSHFFALRH